MYAKNEGGKVVENLLRNIVTGEGAENLLQTEGMQRVALQNKPSQARIERDVRKLRSAFVLQGNKKVMKRLSPELKELVIKRRTDRSGYTGRSLEYPNWSEARKGRIFTISNDLTEDTHVTINTASSKPKAKFSSRQGGVVHLNKMVGLATDAVAKTKELAKQYVKLAITKDIKKFTK